MFHYKLKLNTQRLEVQPGTVLGYGFYKYHTPYTKQCRALLAKAKEDIAAEEKT